MRHPFQCTVPILVTHGKTEVLYDSITQFVRAMEEIGGNIMWLLQLGDTPHDIMLTGVATGFVREAVGGGIRALDFLIKLGL